MSAKASTSVTLPARIDFTSDPASTSPASSVSSTWYSWRARLLRASTFTSSAGAAFAMGVLRSANYSVPRALTEPRAGRTTWR